MSAADSLYVSFHGAFGSWSSITLRIHAARTAYVVFMRRFLAESSRISELGVRPRRDGSGAARRRITEAEDAVEHVGGAVAGTSEHARFEPLERSAAAGERALRRDD